MNTPQKDQVSSENKNVKTGAKLCIQAIAIVFLAILLDGLSLALDKAIILFIASIILMFELGLIIVFIATLITWIKEKVVRTKQGNSMQEPVTKSPISNHADAGDVKQNAQIILETLAEFDIKATIKEVNIGPKVSEYVLITKDDTSSNAVKKVETNLAVNLHAQALRITGRSTSTDEVIIEIPNRRAAKVGLSEALASDEWKQQKAVDSFVVGKSISGDVIYDQLTNIQNLIITGQTGSGKSTMLNSIIISLLSKNDPSTLKLVLIDPKMVEFSPYIGTSHLLYPLITNPDEWISALKDLVEETNKRLELLKSAGHENIDEYNKSAQDILPRIVAITDEFSDMMMHSGNEIEQLLSTITAGSKSTGIHTIISTSRPSSDVYTDKILRMFQTKWALTVASPHDSQRILGATGAEKLLGQGDLLYRKSPDEEPTRLQAVHVSDEEVAKTVDQLLKKYEQYD